MAPGQIASNFKELKAEVLNALFAHSESLEELRFSGIYNKTEAMELGDLGSVSDLKLVKVLSIPFHLLMGPNRPQGSLEYLQFPDLSLPPSTEKLTLLIEEDTKREHVDLYLQSVYFACIGHSLPYLRTITLQCRYGTASSLLDIINMHKLFSILGVRIQYYIELHTSCLSSELPEQVTPWILEEYLRTEKWKEELQMLPNLVRLEREDVESIVATSLHQNLVADEVRYASMR